MIFLKNTSSAEAIFNHLSNVDHNFKPPLSSKISIVEYAKKIFEKAQRFECWIDGKLVALVALYINIADKKAFITNVSVEYSWKGRGIAKSLLLQSFEFCLQESINVVELEVSKKNQPAIRLYNTMNFVQTSEKDDSYFLTKRLNQK